MESALNYCANIDPASAQRLRGLIKQMIEGANDEQLAKVRLLWSFMRMWMEWTYAWKRWDEFHTQSSPRHAPLES